MNNLFVCDLCAHACGVYVHVSACVWCGIYTCVRVHNTCIRQGMWYYEGRIVKF